MTTQLQSVLRGNDEVWEIFPSSQPGASSFSQKPPVVLQTARVGPNQQLQIGNWHSLSPLFHEGLWWVKIQPSHNQNLFGGDNVLQALLFLSMIRLHIANLWPLRHSWLCVAIGLQPVTNNWTFVLSSCMALQAIPSCCWKTIFFFKYIKIIHLFLFLQWLFNFWLFFTL